LQSKQGWLPKGARGVLLRALLLVFTGAAAAPGIASAVVLSNVANIVLAANLAQGLSVSLPSGAAVNFALANGGPVGGDVPVVISTSWNLNPGQTGAVSLYAYFSVPAQALTDGGGNSIASSLVQGRVTTGLPTTFTPFTQTNPVGPAGGSLLLFSENITGINKSKTRSDNLDLQIDLTGQAIPAGTYTGTLRIQARAL
jgi:hypothetical protein